jgi:hypothetical protein
MHAERRRALVVGIDDYPPAPLSGCVADARAVAELLTRHADGSPNFDVRLITSPPKPITRSILREAIRRLFGHDVADIALLYFAGHGTENDLGGYLVTSDARAYDEGVALTEVLTWANESRAGEAVVILDSCMSGALGHLPATGSDRALLREGLSILTASRSGQVSLETSGGGLFTELVCGALEGGAADVEGRVTAASVYSYVEQALGPWEQRPLFKAHLSRLVPLRLAAPAVPITILRRLPAWFPGENDIYPLDPSYEPTAEPHIAEHEEIFSHFQRCRAAKLLEPVDQDHLYYAAMHSTGCRLTALGRHYWRLANRGRI